MPVYVENEKMPPRRGGKNDCGRGAYSDTLRPEVVLDGITTFSALILVVGQDQGRR